MKQQEVFKKIGGILKELNDQYEYLQAIPGRLNDLELELFLANSHFLSDHLLILSKLNSQTIPEHKPEAPQKEKYFEPLVQPIVPVKNGVDEKFSEDIKLENDSQSTGGIDLGTGTTDSYSYIREDEPETIRHELILDDADWDEEELEEDEQIEQSVAEGEIDEPVMPLKPVTATNEEIKPVIATTEEIKPVEEKPQPVAVKEPVKEKIPTINDRMSAQLAEKTGIADQLHTQKISDLKTAITLNDKLLFIKDLFNGYSLAYSEAIEILNRFSSFNEAETFLTKNYVVKNNWESKPETNAKFYTLLKRRYA